MVSSAVDLFFSKRDIYTQGKAAKDRYITEITLGIDALFKVNSFVKSGAVGALSVENEFNFNYNIEFTSTELLNFLKNYFPEALCGEKGDTIYKNISQDRLYELRTYDMT